MKPYAYRTTDFGKTWTRAPAQESGVRGYAHVIKEDPVNPNLLFLGTEFGLWISVDGGQHWAQYKGSNFPAVAVRDIAVHPRDGDLVLATHGRGIWIIDDISSAARAHARPDDEGSWADSRHGRWSVHRREWRLGRRRRELSPAATGPEERRLPTTSAPGTSSAISRSRSSIEGQAGGHGRRQQAPRPEPRHLVDALEAAGGSARGDRAVAAAQGPRVLPGAYTVKMTKGDKVYTEQLNVVLDPRAKFTVEDRKAQFDLTMKLYHTDRAHDVCRGGN